MLVLGQAVVKDPLLRSVEFPGLIEDSSVRTIMQTAESYIPVPAIASNGFSRESWTFSHQPGPACGCRLTVRGVYNLQKCGRSRQISCCWFKTTRMTVRCRHSTSCESWRSLTPARVSSRHFGLDFGGLCALAPCAEASDSSTHESCDSLSPQKFKHNSFMGSSIIRPDQARAPTLALCGHLGRVLISNGGHTHPFASHASPRLALLGLPEEPNPR
jgi:hypothetical protein